MLINPFKYSKDPLRFYFSDSIPLKYRPPIRDSIEYVNEQFKFYLNKEILIEDYRGVLNETIILQAGTPKSTDRKWIQASYSYVGTVQGRPFLPKITFYNNWFNMKINGDVRRRNLSLHEFGHALGLEHEKTWHSIMYYRSGLWAWLMPWKRNFRKVTREKIITNLLEGI